MNTNNRYIILRLRVFFILITFLFTSFAFSTPALAAPAGAPVNLTAAIVSTGRIDLAWTNPVNNESVITVEKKTGSGDYVTIATLARTATAYPDVSTFVVNTAYTYRVSTYAGVTKLSSDPVIVTMALPAAPAVLTLVVVSGTRIDLQWQDKSSTEDGFKIERKTDSGSFVQIGTAIKNATTFSDTTVTFGHIYTYRVYSYNILGPSSSTSNEVATSAIMVFAPNSLTIDSVTSNSAGITWSYPSGKAYITQIERRISSSDTWSSVEYLPAGTVKYTNTGLTQNTKYYYRVRALDGAIYSLTYPNNNIGIEAFTKLAKPTALSAVLITGTSAYLSWTDNSTETEFTIERKRGTGSYSTVATVSANTTHWTNTGLTSGVNYTYRVRARTSTNLSDYSDEAVLQMVILAAPSNLVVNSAANNTALLNWNDNSTNETGFEVWRKTGTSGQWSLLATISQNSRAYIDSTLSTNNQYYYKVRAYYGVDGVYSDYTADVGINTNALIAPSNLSVTEYANYFVKLTWTDNSNNETGFVIERRFTGTAYAPIAQVEANTTSYLNKGLYQQTGCYYRVKAINGSMSSAYSPEIFVMTLKTVTFNDMANYSWALEAVDNMATRGIIKGTGYNMFSPGSTITRAEFVALLLRSYKLGNFTPSGGFIDVPAGKWYYRELTAAKMLGIISGDNNNKFYPDAPITREDSALVIANTLRAANKALPIYNSSVLNIFNDKSQISGNTTSSMSSLVGEGIFIGRPDGNIGPRDSATRAEAALLIYRIIDKYIP